MTRRNRSQWNRAFAAAFGAALLMGVSGAASADHERHRAGEGPPVYHHGSYCDRSTSFRGHYRADDRRHDRRYHRANHHRLAHHEAAYTCRPCNHRFDSRDAFHRHLSHHHHVQHWVLPFVVVRHALGWIFYG